MNDRLIIADSAEEMLWWVLPGRLAGMPMPYLHPARRLGGGGTLDAWADDLPALHRAGIRTIVCLLNLSNDPAIYRQAGFEFAMFPIPDGFPPEVEQACDIINFIRTSLQQDRPVAVHCLAGIGRTGTVLAAYLISEGASAMQAISRIRAAEPSAIETQRQLEFLDNFERYCRGARR